MLSTCKFFHTVKKTRRCFKRPSKVIWWSNNCIYVFLLIVTCWSFCSIISPIAAVLYITKVNCECLSLGAVNNIGWRFHGLKKKQLQCATLLWKRKIKYRNRSSRELKRTKLWHKEIWLSLVFMNFLATLEIGNHVYIVTNCLFKHSTQITEIVSFR